MTEEGYFALAEAIIRQAVEDYRDAYLRLLRKPDDETAAKEVGKIRKFFRSAYFSVISGLDGPLILRKLTKMAEGEFYERK